ncbi:MAG: flagellar basal body-associated FliL family protein [Opitutales bacterium]|nr:flagellar basal body-associated FliL family protein [Opitutales bacterium]
MAKEKMEEITPNAAPAESGKSGGGMMPAIVVLVLMPVISFAITKFVFIPQIQSAVVDAAHQVASADGSGHAAAGAATGGHSAPAADSHGAAAAGSHGGGGHGGAAESAGAASSNTYPFENIVANLSGTSINRYVKVSFIVEGSRPDFSVLAEANRVKMIDATLGVLSSLTSADLQNPGIKNTVRSKLIAAYDTVLKERVVTGLYFSEFVVQ